MDLKAPCAVRGIKKECRTHYLSTMNRFLALIALVTVLLTFAACQQDPCEEVSCQNGGVCMEGTCDCPEGFTGDQCESFESSEFLGTYAASYDCIQVAPNHRVDIQLKSLADTLTQLELLQLGDYECPNGVLSVSASVSLNQLTIPSQQIDCGGIVYNVEGSGELQGGRLTLSFTNRYDAGGIMVEDVCNATLEKQL